MVSVNGENRHGDVEIGIVNVRGKNRAGKVHVDEVKALRFVSDAVFSQQLQRAVHDRSGQFVFVEQVSPEKYKIHLILTRKLQNLSKHVDAVTAHVWVQLLKPEVDVCSDENFESIVLLVSLVDIVKL